MSIKLISWLNLESSCQISLSFLVWNHIWSVNYLLIKEPLSDFCKKLIGALDLKYVTLDFTRQDSQWLFDETEYCIPKSCFQKVRMKSACSICDDHNCNKPSIQSVSTNLKRLKERKLATMQIR